MKKIQLSQGQFALVDDDDYDRLSKYKWCALKHHTGKYYAARTDVANNRKTIRMHRFIMGICDDTDKVADHINNDPLDNRKVNLRVCTKKENAKNRTSKKGASSVYLGVNISGNGFIARVGSGEDRKYLGYFSCEIEAAKAYDIAAKEMHGEFANLNFG